MTALCLLPLPHRFSVSTVIERPSSACVTRDAEPLVAVKDGDQLDSDFSTFELSLLLACIIRAYQPVAAAVAHHELFIDQVAAQAGNVLVE